MAGRLSRLKYGRLQRAAFAEPGGESLREWIDACPNQDYSALTYQGGANWRERLLEDLGDQGDICRLLDRRSDTELAALMENLGGNCVSTLADAFASINHDGPVCFLAYTIKGWGTPIAGHKDNHGGLMTPAQMSDWQQMMGVREGHEWDPFEAVPDAKGLEKFIKNRPFFAVGSRRQGINLLIIQTRVTTRSPHIHATSFWQNTEQSGQNGQPTFRTDYNDEPGCIRHNQPRAVDQ